MKEYYLGMEYNKETGVLTTKNGFEITKEVYKDTLDTLGYDLNDLEQYQEINFDKEDFIYTLISIKREFIIKRRYKSTKPLKLKFEVETDIFKETGKFKTIEDAYNYLNILEERI